MVYWIRDFRLQFLFSSSHFLGKRYETINKAAWIKRARTTGVICGAKQKTHSLSCVTCPITPADMNHFIQETTRIPLAWTSPRFKKTVLALGFLSVVVLTTTATAMVSATHTEDIASLAEVNLFEVEPREDFGMDEEDFLSTSLDISLPSDLDLRICEGSDWEGYIEGATELRYVSPYSGDTLSWNSTTSSLTFIMPWTEAAMAIDAGDPTSFEMEAISEVDGVECSTLLTLTLEVVGNPEIDPNTSIPESICVGETILVNSGFGLEGAYNGQPFEFLWSNEGTEDIFDIALGNSGTSTVNGAANPPTFNSAMSEPVGA